MSNIRKILTSALALFGFIVLAAFEAAILPAIGLPPLPPVQRALFDFAQIGIWLSAAAFCNSLIRAFFWDGMAANAFAHRVPKLLTSVTSLLIYTVAVSGIVGYVFHQPLTGIWTTGGLVGLVFGLALQSTIRDIFVGLAINIDRPFQIGDYIMVYGAGADAVSGEVMEINWRTTRLLTDPGYYIILPNSTMGTATISNFSKPHAHIECEVIVCLDFEIPTEQARRVLLAATFAVGRARGMVDTPVPFVRVRALTPVGIEYGIVFHRLNSVTRDNIRNTVLTSVLDHLRNAGLGPAYPKQDLYYSEMPVRYLDSKSMGDRIKLLARTELFSPLTPDELESLAQRMKRRRIGRGETLFVQGDDADAGDSLFILFEGLLTVMVRGEENQDVLVGQLTPGEFVGEMSVLTGEPRSATVQAATDSRAYEITKHDIAEVIAARPELMTILSRVVAERRTRTERAMAHMPDQESGQETAGLAQQILNKMTSFFGSLLGDRKIP